MKRIIALLLICVMIPGTICSAAGEKTGTPDVVSYQFDLKLHLEADAFPFRERKLMQGYEELLYKQKRRISDQSLVYLRKKS